jgi:DNA-binding FrmR family transcriptional regulator
MRWTTPEKKQKKLHRFEKIKGALSGCSGRMGRGKSCASIVNIQFTILTITDFGAHFSDPF